MTAASSAFHVVVSEQYALKIWMCCINIIGIHDYLPAQMLAWLYFKNGTAFFRWHHCFSSIFQAYLIIKQNSWHTFTSDGLAGREQNVLKHNFYVIQLGCEDKVFQHLTGKIKNGIPPKPSSNYNSKTNRLWRCRNLSHITMQTWIIYHWCCLKLKLCSLT